VRRFLSYRWLAAVLAVLGALALALWLIPSSHYIVLPDKAQRVDPLVEITGEGQQASASDGGIYSVYVLVRKANLFERAFPGLFDGADLVPGRRINPEGVSDEQRRKSNRLYMTRSQDIAAAVALEALGYDVDVKLNGAEISVVVPNSPAAKSDLQPADVIVRAEGQAVEGPDDLRDALADVEPGQTVTLGVRRSGGVRDLAVETMESDREAGRAVVGVLVQQSARFDLPVEIEIDAGPVGGPSAGLAFALDIVDELGSDVDQGRLIVATGELTFEGRVLPIGGVKQKVIGARDAGADIFVVPVANAKEAERYAGDLEIVPVATFEEALSDLAWRSGAPPEIENGNAVTTS
jgi:PDZ domain-containing protein